jgi:triosephosphate isomerase
MRKKIVAGNWKMNKTLAEAEALTKEVITLANSEIKSKVKIVLCVPFPFLQTVNRLVSQSTVEV